MLRYVLLLATIGLLTACGSDTEKEATSTTPAASAPLTAADYRAKVENLGLRVSSNLKTISGLTTAAKPDDPQWRINYRETATTIKSFLPEARALTPPDCLKPAHETLIKALGSLDEAMTQLLSNQTAPNPTAVQASGRLIEESGQYITNANKQMTDATC